MSQEVMHDKKDAEENKIIAALSYVWILVLVPLFLKRNSAFAQFHAKQGLLLFIIEIVGWLIFWIPVLGQIVLVAVIVFAVLGIKSALEGKYWTMPVLGKYASKLNI